MRNWDYQIVAWGCRFLPAALVLSARALPAAGGPALERSDVVFMYQADRATYQRYGATVLAWGGTPAPRSLAAAEGLAFFGSVGMVTEFARYHDRFPQTYDAGLCRDIDGAPFKVPWLTDHQHEGIPYWWCCTQQPLFRQYIEERVVETVRAGAHGVHIDDHLGSAGALFLGGCFCDRCRDGFRGHLASLSAEERDRLGVGDPAQYDVRDAMRAWREEGRGGRPRRLQQHPLWNEWSVYHCRAAAAFMQRLRTLAAETAGRQVPMSANAGVLWPNHLADYESLDFFSAEIEHGAGERVFSERPLFAYRLADAVGRPLAATASGQDWAFIKEENLPGLVRGWIALGYAAGHSLMAPHRQWCYTEEKGTHWYEGPAEAFAPLYQFVRRHRELFDGYEAYADVVLVVPHRRFLGDRERWLGMGERLSRANVPWRIALGGDDLVEHRIEAADFEGARVILDPDPAALEPRDRVALEGAARALRRAETVAAALEGLVPAVRVEGSAQVRALPRVKPGSAVIHVLNWDYRAERDGVEPAGDVTLILDLAALGVPGARTARVFAPEAAESADVAVEAGSVRLPVLGLWALVQIPIR